MHHTMITIDAPPEVVREVPVDPERHTEHPVIAEPAARPAAGEQLANRLHVTSKPTATGDSRNEAATNEPW